MCVCEAIGVSSMLRLMCRSGALGEDLDLPTPGETLESGVTKSLFATE